MVNWTSVLSVWISGLWCVAAAGFIEECVAALHTRNLERQWTTSSSTNIKMAITNRK